MGSNLFESTPLLMRRNQPLLRNRGGVCTMCEGLDGVARRPPVFGLCFVGFVYCPSIHSAESAPRLDIGAELA